MNQEKRWKSCGMISYVSIRGGNTHIYNKIHTIVIFELILILNYYIRINKHVILTCVYIFKLNIDKKH